MEYLMDQALEPVANRILQAPHVFFLLDYDGTLTPIMPKPPMARLHESTRKILESLVKNPAFSVGVITGRKLEEIKPLIKLKNVVYGGNHGLELQGPDFSYTHAKAKQSVRMLREISETLQAMSVAFPGTFVEDKGVTLTFHYRLLDLEWVDNMRLEFIRRVSPWLDDKKIKVMDAEKAYEIVPNLNWNKGSAVQWILLHESPESLPVYIGDDKTDENPFRVLDERGITVRVGYESKSNAHFYVKDTYEVEKFLSMLGEKGERLAAVQGGEAGLLRARSEPLQPALTGGRNGASA